MKKIRAAIDKWLEGLDRSWDALPIQKQHKYILYFFTGYMLLSTMVLFHNCTDLHNESRIREKIQSNNDLQDTLIHTLKNRNYEQKQKKDSRAR